MSIDYSLLKFSKGTPRVVSDINRKRDAAKEEKDCRLKVDRRDKHKCFYPGCRKHAGEKHHIVSSSVRGKRIWRSDDILSACTPHHRWFKAGLIQVTGNPDLGPVTVLLTKLGIEAGIRLPVVKTVTRRRTA